ncbi:MAG TPA: DUF3619 family protein [Burkholderiaceae bacterium]
MAQFGLRVAASLSQQAEALPADVSERLRFAREKAIETARASRKLQTVSTTSGAAVAMGQTLALGGGPRSGPGRWFKLAAVLPVLFLLAGLLLIQHSEWYEQVTAAAEIDTALLSDKLPPAAYSDPGFSEYLSDEQEQ